MISGFMTALLLIIFIGIVLWAYSKKNKDTFKDLSQMALDEEDRKKTVEKKE
jgi:Cbb3-type cytochrome oxidase component FixQ.